MRFILLFVYLSLSILVKAQAKFDSRYNELPFKVYFIESPDRKKSNFFETEFKLQETAFLNYKKNGLCCFIIIESILNEILKPEPAINKTGFYGCANPFLEIEETKGNTGFIKFGMLINLSFK